MPQLKQAVCASNEKHRQNTKLWNSYLQNPTERLHEALWHLYQPLVRLVAERFNEKVEGRHELAALIDAGNVGLLDALAAFSPKHEPTFESLAVPMIREAMARSLMLQHSKDERVLRLEMNDARGMSDEARLREAALRQLNATLRRLERAMQ